ncbi:hypothetical protein [Leptothrix discophora]|uniref:Uncharacterized protein n=1 Tax=Leptothrix discophora TaxID=89 RepID=A0ABT9G1N9_LEPDI|nr:hypothetical protein [Leptothrix discophora]MDP4300404.1 hypothetical protein [Leptothrix discophora]
MTWMAVSIGQVIDPHGDRRAEAWPDVAELSGMLSRQSAPGDTIACAS